MLRWNVEIVLVTLTLVVFADACTRKRHQALLVAGSTTVAPVLREVSKAFHKSNPEMNITVEGGGSTAAVVALRNRAVDIAALSRDLQKSEENVDNFARPFAVEGLAVIVHPSNTLEGLKADVLAKIITGTIKDWAEVAGAAGPIHVVLEQAEGMSRSAINDLILKGDEVSAAGIVLASQTKVRDRIAADPLAIGLVTLPLAGKGVRMVSLNGVMPSVATVLSGRYPLSRTFFLIQGRNQSDVANKFIGFLQHGDARLILSKFGLIPVMR